MKLLLRDDKGLPRILQTPPSGMDPTVNPQQLSSNERSNDRRTQQRRQSNARTLLATVIIMAVLYTARQVFIPVALAILFAFLLRPIVAYLERTFLKRRGAVAVVLSATVALIGLGAWALYDQTNAMATEIAQRSGNLEKKFAFMRQGGGGSFRIVERTLSRITETSAERAERPQMNVRVVERTDFGARYKKIAPTIEFVASSFLVIVLVFFLLDEQERMRDRLLRIAGRAHLTVTTQAIGETGQRISRFLLTQAVMNLLFGVIIGAALFFMGIPHAIVCGVLTAVLRFVPYVGAVLSGALPTFLALAFFPGWVKPLEVLAVYVVLDQFFAGFVEPAVIGHRVGVSPIALLVSAIFWGWLWGPVGLLLATPITVCLTVGGEFIPALRIFSILFGTEAPLEDYLSFYNRLLIRDRSGAAAIADRFAEESSMEETFEKLFVPALTFATEELERKRITRANDHFIKDTIRELIIRLGDREAHVDESLPRLVAVSVAHERLSLGSLMLSQVLRAEGRPVDYFTDLTEEELLEYIEEVRPVALLVSCSNPAHNEEGLRLLSHIRAAAPNLPVIAGGSAFVRIADQTQAAGASIAPSTLTEAKNAFDRLVRARR